MNGRKKNSKKKKSNNKKHKKSSKDKRKMNWRRIKQSGIKKDVDIKKL